MADENLLQNFKDFAERLLEDDIIVYDLNKCVHPDCIFLEVMSVQKLQEYLTLIDHPEMLPEMRSMLLRLAYVYSITTDRP